MTRTVANSFGPVGLLVCLSGHSGVILVLIGHEIIVDTSIIVTKKVQFDVLPSEAAKSSVYP